TEINFEIEQKQAVEKAEQEKKDAVAAQERKRQIVVRNTFIVGFILIFIVVLLLYARYKTKAKTTKLLEDQNQVINERNVELDRLSIVARETGNFVFILDAVGKVEWANESFTRINNITLEELKKQKGETIYELSNTPDIRNIIETAVREKKTMVYESHIHDKDGKSIWGSSTLTPTFDSTGKLKKMIIVDTDITERKKDEEIIKEKNKDITDSIRYAKRLQDATMPPIKQIKNFLPDFFVLYKPKDIVAGDFYWIKKQGETVFVAAADCTGHGVPGSLVSIVCSNALNRAVKEFGLTETGLILDKTRELVVETFEKSQSNVQDGMDISLIALSQQANGSVSLQWSGANNPLWYIKDGKLNEITADKQPIGKYYNTKPFTTHTATLAKCDTIYLFTDGYADQFGGEKGKKFKYKHLQEVIQSINGLGMELQKEKLEAVFEEWKGNLEQVDDVCIFGIRI
ncbi:MAG TPA: SpoIIE family protein phosphatase, partial [Bacteroidia bacterium]|nr:SpoIIE family protein phosphatase [Bacteroidia bacterium]